MVYSSYLRFLKLFLLFCHALDSISKSLEARLVISSLLSDCHLACLTFHIEVDWRFALSMLKLLGFLKQSHC